MLQLGTKSGREKGQLQPYPRLWEPETIMSSPHTDKSCGLQDSKGDRFGGLVNLGCPSWPGPSGRVYEGDNAAGVALGMVPAAAAAALAQLMKI